MSESNYFTVQVPSIFRMNFDVYIDNNKRKGSFYIGMI